MTNLRLLDATAKTAQIRLNRSSPHYWRVTFDNPPLNLMGPEFVLEFREIMTAIETDAFGKIYALLKPNQQSKAPQFAWIECRRIIGNDGNGPNIFLPTSKYAYHFRCRRSIHRP